jgi:hypothetical protein
LRGERHFTYPDAVVIPEPAWGGLEFNVMRNLIANALSVVLLWAFIGPAALVAASGQETHECCYRTHHPVATSHSRFENQGPSHECCRLLFTSQAPTVAAVPSLFGTHTRVPLLPIPARINYTGIQLSSHPERAPPFLA